MLITNVPSNIFRQCAQNLLVCNTNICNLFVYFSKKKRKKKFFKELNIFFSNKDAFPKIWGHPNCKIVLKFLCVATFFWRAEAHNLQETLFITIPCFFPSSVDNDNGWKFLSKMTIEHVASKPIPLINSFFTFFATSLKTKKNNLI